MQPLSIFMVDKDIQHTRLRTTEELIA